MQHRHSGLDPESKTANLSFFPLLLLLFPFSLFSESIFTFSDQELISYKKRFGSGIEQRVKGFHDAVENIRSVEKNRQLNRVNTLVNSYLPEYDVIINKREDYWSTPKEFLAAGFGDCEEYAIMKYFTLQSLGFDEKQLCLSVVKDRYSGSYHMVLAYYEDKEPLVLDNLSFRILPLSKRIDLQPGYCVNKQGVFKLDKQGKRTRVPQKDAKFEDLMKRIGQGR